MDSDSDASIVSGTTKHSGKDSPDLTISFLNKIGSENPQNEISACGDVNSPIIPVARSKFRNVIDDPVYCSPLKKKRQATADEESDPESCCSQSILTNYKQKAFTQAKSWEAQDGNPVKNPVVQNKTKRQEDSNHVKQLENVFVVSQDSDVTRISSTDNSQQENENQRLHSKETTQKKRVREQEKPKQSEEEICDLQISQMGGSQLLFPDTQSSTKSMEKQVVQCSQTSSGMSTASSNLNSLDSILTKEQMEEAFMKIRKIHTQIEKNIRDKNVTEECRESFEKKLAVVHKSLKNISEKMSYEKVKITFDVKHSVKTVESRNKLREEMKDLTQRQTTLKKLLVKQAELTKYLKLNPGNLTENQSQETKTKNKSSPFSSKVNDWMNKNQVPRRRDSLEQSSSIPKTSSVEECSSGVKAIWTVPKERSETKSTGNTQVAQPKTIPAVLSNAKSLEKTSNVKQPNPVLSNKKVESTQPLSSENSSTVIYVYPNPSNSSLVSNMAATSTGIMSQKQSAVTASTPSLSPSSTRTSPSSTRNASQMKNSSQIFRRPSEIIKSPPLFNPDSFLRKTMKSPPVQSQNRLSFRSPPISLLRSVQDKNISPSTVCSSDVFPVSCKELGRRIQERIASQREAETQQASQMLSATSERRRSEDLFSERKDLDGGYRQEAQKKAVLVKNQGQAESGTKSNAAITCINLEEDGSESRYEKFGGLKFPPLKTLIDLAVLFPAEDILTVQHSGRVFTASLTDQGYIESRGGEIFTTPMRWLSAVKAGEIIKKAQAYREVMYDGHSLKSYVEGEHETSLQNIQGIKTKSTNHKSKDMANVQETDNLGSSKLMNDEDKQLADLLFQCKIHLLDESDLIPMDDLPENFWCSDFSSVHLSRTFWNQVNDWDGLVQPMSQY
ncbi:uncharacterized protein LOC133204772 [Saccostrea echinata]|uniref:uncharacterized protein LOC133204772 n=1 Tax=Saccostrea echinata TaxID=191078 RepID=UPI002A83A0D2|nr:uncharacterized protein LOC133204772 [Saccostrea echinata]